LLLKLFPPAHLLHPTPPPHYPPPTYLPIYLN
jgi:hypothetical protein